MKKMVNYNKICFITCVTDDRLYKEVQLYIQRLHVPAGMQVEYIAVRDAMSMTAGYNEAMRITDAKYKVYLHQDVCIIHRDFIQDIIDIFKADANIGILGMVGTADFSEDGIWWHTKSLLGSIYDNHHTDGMMKYCYRGNENKWNDAVALDGLLLATQYDIPWRADLFSNWHFYDVSQCMEFRRNGYKAVVAGQVEPWCIHMCQLKKEWPQYDEERRKFFIEYRTDQMPLVSVLILVEDKPPLFYKSLQSILQQTYKNVELLIWDNSKTEEIANQMQQYQQNRRIKYYHNKGLEKKESAVQFFRTQAHGEFCQWVIEYTVFDKEKIEKMVQCFLLNKSVKLVTSKCKQINQNEKNVKNFFSMDFGTLQNCIIINGLWLYENLLIKNINFINSMDHVLFKYEDVKDSFGLIIKNETNYDICLCKKLLKKGDCGYFQEYLSMR